MDYYLAQHNRSFRTRWVKRFSAGLWTVDFARPIMAALSVVEERSLRVSLDFLTKRDLAGLIWASEDRWSHPLLAYETDRDYRGVKVAFDWMSGPGVMPLDQVNGPTLTIEGRDAAGEAAIWYVRLWNYASGSPTSARITLDFDNLVSGYALEEGAVWAGDIDRMFLSVVPEDYDGSAQPLPAGVSTFVDVGNIVAEGRRSAIRMGDCFLPEHGLRICSGYDDSYHQPPERLVEQWQALGYREVVNHYVGMSHYFALTSVGGGRYEVGSGLCSSAVAWHAGLIQAARQAGFQPIFSLSFEVLADHAPDAWVQRDHLGNRALTGWEPPSTLISPCNAVAINWLCSVARAFADLLAQSGGHVDFQVGEPWWWVGSDGAPCFYDASTVSTWTAAEGSEPPVMPDVVGVRTLAEQQYLDWLGARLAAATSAVIEAARAAAPGRFRSLLLFFAPQVLDAARPDLKRANMPVGWHWPAYDVLQLEDYDHVTSGNEAGQEHGRQAVTQQLGYPPEYQHYLSGFVLLPADADLHWRRVGDAAALARRSAVAEVLVWAWPQIARDGFVWMEMQQGAEDVQQFHDVRFPLELGFDAVGGPEFATQVASMVSGHEQRNSVWAQGRLRYDAAVGVRSEQDLAKLVGFFRARRGQAAAFRFRDPLDWHSNLPGEAPTALDQFLGEGDGTRLSFPLVKRYGEMGVEEVRRITRPIAASVMVSVAGEVVTNGWELIEGGIIRFEDAPVEGASVCAGFEFDVPVRFATDQLDVSLSRWQAGELPAVPLVEVRE